MDEPERPFAERPFQPGESGVGHGHGVSVSCARAGLVEVVEALLEVEATEKRQPCDEGGRFESDVAEHLGQHGVVVAHGKAVAGSSVGPGVGARHQ